MVYKFISDEVVKGKTILFHAMMDLPVVDGRIDVSSARFEADLNDLRGLSEKGAKLVVFTWQSRPGKSDFLHLGQHAAAVGKALGREVKQFNWGEDFVSAIRQMKEGEIIFLDNARMHPDQNFNGPEKTPEDYAKTDFVKTLAPLCDCFCNNALSQSHRAECSVVGFTSVLPSFVGPSLKRELDGLNAVRDKGSPKVLLFGGMKNSDSVKLIPAFLENGKVGLVLAGGFLGELFLKAGGVELGGKDNWIKERAFLEFNGLVDDAKAVLREFGEKILLPVDVAVDANGERKSIPVEELPSEFLAKDIGDKTIDLFSEKLKAAKTIIWNGPMGVYEEQGFIKGTRALAGVMAKGNAYTIVGGGNTATAAERAGFQREKFSHVSTAGKAALQYLSGKPLVGLLALEQ